MLSDSKRFMHLKQSFRTTYKTTNPHNCCVRLMAQH